MELAAAALPSARNLFSVQREGLGGKRKRKRKKRYKDKKKKGGEQPSATLVEPEINQRPNNAAISLAPPCLSPLVFYTS